VLFRDLWRMAPFWGERIIYPRSANSFWGSALRRASTQEQATYKQCDHLDCVAFVKPIAVWQTACTHVCVVRHTVGMSCVTKQCEMEMWVVVWATNEGSNHGE